MSLIALKDISLSRSSIPIVANISFQLQAGSCVCLTGHSGCGKTTILQGIAELIPYEDGDIQRNYHQLGYLFQQPRLLPWRTVLENLTVLPNVATDATILQLAQLDLTSYDQRKYPHELSGGMQQRVALARALIIQPDVLLMDEPFSALDYQLRQRLQTYIQHRIEEGLGVILVSHDREEALRLATTIIRLDGTPARIVSTLDINISYSERTQDFIQSYIHHPTLQGIDET
ncbi:ABC transporter ATP-binding protein [Suttonella ornithocola]|uniref:Aliphatic sulfonates import ATP-binding protein SsuB n=1 Tax=Suttonella ornithocola TaxID=279832 RepID=A0A380MLR1_9GAMM|nr:ATP-binding cassette domain-containing protein [Suttonella ornithocola]SUO93188.1 Aliphatic sulfonates import ATP-binding protein SsuB [Suttonella ornithocola]